MLTDEKTAACVAPCIHTAAANKTRLADTCTHAYTIIIIIIYNILNVQCKYRAYIICNTYDAHARGTSAAADYFFPSPFPPYIDILHSVYVYIIYVHKIFYFMEARNNARRISKGGEPEPHVLPKDERPRKYIIYV